MKRVIVVVAMTAALTACGKTTPAPTTWCERDSTDQRVPDSYCLNGADGYEWEPDGDDWMESSHKTTTKKPATTTKKPWYKPAPKTTTKKAPPR